MLLLDNPIQGYDWGPIDGVAEVVGTAPSGGPEAELWVGTHERGPSVVAAGPHVGETLASLIASDPVRYLGPDLAGAGHERLPFLLKVLAIGSALSLQAHPSADQAAAGHAREDRAGLPIDAPDRSYRDPCPKPEALIALADTFALCGFRPPGEAADLVAAGGSPALGPLVELLGSGLPPYALRAALSWLLRLSGPDRQAVALAARDAAAACCGPGPLDPWAWVARLAAEHPGDPTCLAPLLLEVVHLAPGEGVHLPAGNLHAYLHGAGVEIMAASDNVLRGGLTTKHIDVEELLATLDLHPGVPAAPVRAHRPGWTTFDAGEEAFGLARLDPRATPVALSPSAPSLLLALGGDAVVRGADDGEPLVVQPGQAVFVGPGTPVEVVGATDLWWATTGPGLRS